MLTKIGEGGMGVVWRAADERLGREVAIKVLPEELARDPERRRRFETEATAVAALKHPNIVTIYSMEEDAGVHFLAMELVSGQTFDELIGDDGLPWQSFLEFAAQITSAIAAAHAKGITHRDIKPANVMLDADGSIKVLDFGLAKLIPEASEEARTITSNDHTAVGQILGTLAYMSPEQAQGRMVDARSDVFSLGVVLYEMATGRHPFKAENSVSTLSAILTAEPDSAIVHNESLPAELDVILRRCLARDPEDRYPSAAELHDDLERLRTTDSGQFIDIAPAKSAGKGLRDPRVALAAIVVITTALVAGGWYFQRRAKIRWAHETALPEIERLLTDSAWFGDLSRFKAFQLGREAERYIPDDPLLDRLRERYSKPITLRSDPPGAQIFALPYRAEDEEWELLGETPLEDLRYATGVLRLRVVKPGFETTEDLFWNPLFVSQGLGYELLPAGSGPDGMVWASDSAPRMMIEAAPAGIHMPGIEHLPPQDLGSFFIDRYEVTNREFQAFVDAGGYEDPDYWRHPFIDGERELSWDEARARFTDSTGRYGPAGWEVGDFRPGTEDHPVAGISWFEAAAFAFWAGKSLPTIYHWDRTALTWASGDIVPLGNLEGRDLLPVGTTRSMNRYGAYDLAGNVREWCANPSSRGGRMILGGGWNDPAYAFNDAFAQSPWDRSPTNGVRCVTSEISDEARRKLEHTIDLPFRDFLNEETVSDETFALYKNQFSYDPEPLQAEIEETLVEDDYVREKITFNAGYGGERMAAYLFLPKGVEPPYQTVVYFPGSGAIHQRSSAELAPGSSLFILKSGRAFLWPIYKSTFERGDGLVSDYPDLSANWRDHIIMWGKDLRRSIDYLESRADIDHDRIAFQGSSWGAAMAPIMIAIEPRIRAGIVIVAGLNFQTALPEVDEINYIGRVTAPMLMLNGKYDFFFPYETSQLPYFELLGTPDDEKKLVVHETSHSFPNTDRARESLAWLDRHLGPVD